MKHKLFNKTIKNVFYILITIITLTCIYNYYYNTKETYYFILSYFFRPIINYQSKYFFDNFNNIIKPHYNDDIIVGDNKININRNAKNEYSLLNKNITNGLLDDLKIKNPDHSTLDVLLGRIAKYIHCDQKPVHVDDLVIVDLLNIPGNYFPFFHTDLEWGTFCQSNGFQIWILLEEDDEIKPRGNMFIMETDMVEPARAISIQNNGVTITKNGSGYFFPEITSKFNSIDELNPKIKYLDAKIGEVFIMNPSVFHCSDLIVKNTKRRAINFRVLYKPTNNLDICDFENNYTKLIRSVHDFNCNDKFCSVNESNEILKYRYK